MHTESKNVLLVSMPFAGIDIPSIQIGLLKTYLEEQDINADALHLYLKAADFYKINNYVSLIYPPNDSYTTQMIFSKYEFPEHWNKNKEKFEDYFNNKMQNLQNFSFEEYEKQTDIFFNWILTNINWKYYEIIGFTLNYGQFLPSLAVAKKIKEQYPEKQIILGGSRTIERMGIKTLEKFPYIDFIVSGEGEEALTKLAKGENFESIPGLIYRKEGKIQFNNQDVYVDLNSLPIPDYISFYEQLKMVSSEIKQFFFCQGKLPVEVSRGCWWNKCTFCNLNIQHKSYREKNVEKIIEEILFLSENYKMLSFQIIGNTIPIKSYRVLCEKLTQLGKDFSFFAETRADQLRRNDYILLKDAGFTDIQTGIESFSQSYLKKMNKGTRVIDNIATLKYCKENQIQNHYNLIINYPNEDLNDFEETKQSIQQIQSYLDPPQICHLRVLYGSNIQSKPSGYNIENLGNTNIDRIMFPEEILGEDFNFVYDFKRKQTTNKDNNWEELINNWKQLRQQMQLQSIQNPNTVNNLVFYFEDGGSFIKIYDKRNGGNINVYILDEIERKILLSCNDISSLGELKLQNTDLSEEQLNEILQNFVESGILFKEDDYYLTLPLQINLSQKQVVKQLVDKEKIEII